MSDTKEKTKPADVKAKRSFTIQMRHVPFATKRATVQATDTADAWKQFCELAKAGKGEKKYKQVDIKAAEEWLAKNGMEQATITEA